MRLSIRQHHKQFISELAIALGASETEALNYLLWQYRKPSTPQQTPVEITPLLGFKPAFEPKTPQAIRQFEDIQLQQEIDPLIERLVGLGICDQF